MENVIFISSNYPPRIGGPATTVPAIAKELSKTFNISVIAFREKGFPNHEKKEFELFRSPSFYFFGFSNPISVLIRTVLLSIYSRYVISKKQCEIIHTHDTHISAIAALFCKYTSIKKRRVIIKYAGDLVLEFSGLENNKGKGIEEIINNPTIKQKLLFFIQKKIFDSGDFIHVQNEYQKQILMKTYHIPLNKIIVIANPVDLNLFKPKNNTNRKEIVILTVSRIVPWKGIDTAIKAMPHLLKKIPNAKLRIIGEGSIEYINALKQLTTKTNVTSKVLFVGKKSNKELVTEYNNASAFVQASLYEPFGITIIEAVSCHLPTIVSNVGGMPEIIKQTGGGLIFETKNEEMLAKKVIETTKMKFKYNTNHYSIKNIVKEIKEMYITILSGKH